MRDASSAAAAPPCPAVGFAIVSRSSSTLSTTSTAFAPASCACHAFSRKKQSPLSTRNTEPCPGPLAFGAGSANSSHALMLEASITTSPTSFAPYWGTPKSPMAVSCSPRSEGGSTT